MDYTSFLADLSAAPGLYFVPLSPATSFLAWPSVVEDTVELSIAPGLAEVRYESV